MDFSSVCRTCISSEDLSPIFENPELENNFREAIFITTGIQVEKDDGYPQKICKNCKNFLDELWSFRSKCLQTELTLVKIKNEKDVAKVTVEIDVKSEKLIKSESNFDEYETEYIDEKFLEEEDKPLMIFVEEFNTTKKIQSEEDIINSINKQKELSKEDSLYIIDDQNRVTCKLCNVKLSIRSVDSHMAKKHPGADKRKVKCELCDKYITETKMKRHMTLTHGCSVADKCYRCGYCKMDFTEKQPLLDHAASCTAKTRKRKIQESGRQIVECDVCSKKMQKASLKMHKAVKHAGLGPVCEHCGKRFGNKLRLKEHYRARHGYEKLRCTRCDFTSSSSMALRNHERRHLNEKPFVCETCNAKFHAAYLLAQHRQSHRTEKLLKCNLCPATFKANNSLHTHKRSCHGSSLHSCTLCSRTYRCRHYAVRHLRQFHEYKGPVPPLLVVTQTEANE